VEQGFDKLFSYDRQQSESFDYHNTMKNGSISEQAKLQEQEIQSSESKAGINQGSNQENLLSINLENKRTIHISIKQENNILTNPSFEQKNNQLSDSFISIVPSGIIFPSNYEEQMSKSKKKKKRKDTNYRLTIYLNKK